MTNNNTVLIARILLPSKTFLEVVVDQVNIPGTQGVFGVLPQAARFISSINIGIVSLFNNNIEMKYYIHGGIAQIKDNEVNIMTEYAASISKSNKPMVTKEIIALREKATLVPHSSIEAKILKTKIEQYQALLNVL